MTLTAPAKAPAPTEPDAVLADESASRPEVAPGTGTPTAAGRGGLGPAIAVSIGLTGALILGFLLYVVAFSALPEARAQHALRQQFAHEVDKAVAPVGPTTFGRPVAALDVPALGVHNLIVVEGTTSRNLMAGPGHLASTPLPGQPGVSTVFGKRETFGAPFQSLLNLEVGDKILVTTGQGRFTYRVSSFGSARRPAPANSANRLLLDTIEAGIGGGPVVMVSADLTSPVADAGGPRAASTAYELPNSRDTAGSVIPLFGWSLVLLLVAVVSTVLFVNGPRLLRWPAALCVAPVAVAVLWSVYESAAGLLPNML